LRMRRGRAKYAAIVAGRNRNRNSGDAKTNYFG
jgi:hypothetical protein